MHNAHKYSSKKEPCLKFSTFKKPTGEFESCLSLIGKVHFFGQCSLLRPFGILPLDILPFMTNNKVKDQMSQTQNKFGCFKVNFNRFDTVNSVKRGLF